MKPWIVHHLYCSVSLINLQYKMISCPGHKTKPRAARSCCVCDLQDKGRRLISDTRREGQNVNSMKNNAIRRRFPFH